MQELLFSNLLIITNSFFPERDIPTFDIYLPRTTLCPLLGQFYALGRQNSF